MNERAGPLSGTATPHTARLINDRLAFDLLLEHGPLTRNELRIRTGLSRPTVGELIDRLEAAGLVAAVGEAGVRRRGPNARLYGVVSDRAHVAGVEVRREFVLAVVTDVTGAQVGAARVALDPAEVPDRLVHKAIEAAMADAGIGPAGLRSVVVGTPGLVDPVGGDVSFVAGLPTWHANLLPGLRDRLGVPVILENEVNLVGLAEHRLGVARGRDDFVLLWLGEGVGVAVVLGGRLYRGASGGAGEVSYLPVGPPPSAGSFQELAGGPAVRSLARAHGVEGETAEDAVRAAVAGDSVGPKGAAFLDSVADRVAFGAAAVCALLDPGFLVLAGEVGRAGGAALAERVAAGLASLTPVPTEVAVGTVDGNPVVRGAVRIALDLLHRETFAL